jgi:hypothetical protein
VKELSFENRVGISAGDTELNIPSPPSGEGIRDVIYSP